MRLLFKHFLLVVFLVSVLIFIGASCSKSTSSSNSTPVATSTVTIKDMNFTPQNINVSSGTVVTWKNEDTVEHQIISDGDLADLMSGILAPNDTFAFTFDKSGTFNYHCNIHPNMKGQVTVK